MTIDDLSEHMAAAGSLERAAAPLGLFLAWCGNLHLLSSAFQEAHAEPLLRLRYRELSPLDFLTTTTGGAIEAEHLTEEGQRFVASYYERYFEDVTRVFNGDPYAAQGDWGAYERMAGVLTRRYMDWKREGRRRRPAGSNESRLRRIWRLIRP